MESSTITKPIVKDLDLTLQPHIAPRYKIWLSLATQQLRLRSLIQIIGHNLEMNQSNEPCWFYYTLHRTSMSSPLYASEPIDNTNPRWASLEVPTLHATGYSTASEIIIRLWKRTIVNNTNLDTTLFAWGICFTGLIYIGPKLNSNLETILKKNTLIFYFHGGYFTPQFCFVEPPILKKYLYLRVDPSEMKDSYTVNKLKSLRSKMQALKQQTESVEALRLKIASGDDIPTPRYPQTSLNRLLQPQRKVNKQKRIEILNIRKELEVAKFRTKLLEQERSRKMGELRNLNQQHATIMDENEDYGSMLMERYRELNKDVTRLREWKQNQSDTRETYIEIISQLAHRRKQLIHELGLIYPIKQNANGKFTINYVNLPDSEELDTCNDTDVAVALGFVVHTTQMIANFLDAPTRYSMIHYGSRSKIIDHITDNLPDNQRQFPLFARSKDKLQFHYGVYLLNKNISQLRWYCGLPTSDLRATLPNLFNLINIKSNQSLDNRKRTFSTSSLDTEGTNEKHNASFTPPPVLNLIFDKPQSKSKSTSQLREIKSSLGFSLDQGLNQPTASQSFILNHRSKRVCKSEESMIDNETLTLRFTLSHTSSSNDTLNDTLINNSISAIMKKQNELSSVDNIEITIPTSVSKLKQAVDSLESSFSVRDRSSNSVSSCEMALSGSQNDVFNVPESDNVSDDTLKNGAASNEEENSLSITGEPSTDIRKEISRFRGPEEQLFINTEDTTSSEDDHSDSRLLEEVDSVQDRIIETMKEVPEQRVPKMNEKINENQHSRLYEYHSSSEYIDFIRRSSENVYARTEALASKTSSFKVMKPRT